MAFSESCKVARKLSDKFVYQFVNNCFGKKKFFIHAIYLNYNKYIATMPPKRKRDTESKKATAPADKSGQIDCEENEVDNKSKPRPRPTREPRAARIIAKSPMTSYFPKSSDSESESEKPTKKRPKKLKAGGDKKAAEDRDVKQKGRKKVKAETDESDNEYKEDEPPKGRAKIKDKDGQSNARKGRKNAKTDNTAAGTMKNKTSTSYDEIDFNNCARKSYDGKDWNFKISNWNVDGIRAWLKKGGLDYLRFEKPDILCLQETKCSLDKLPPEVRDVDGYEVYWHCSSKDGYAGVALYSKIKPISVQYGLDDKEHDDEGRMITAEYEKFYVISVYVPNAGRGLVTLPKRLKWNDVFRNFVAQLDKKKPVIVCGDMNVAHSEIDLANPKTNTKNAGFTKEEREGMTDFLSDGYIDTFRELYPDKKQAYTFWTYMSNCRAKDVGWRLDYFIVSERIKDSVCDNIIRSEVFGSDHCPITLFLNI